MIRINKSSTLLLAVCLILSVSMMLTGCGTGTGTDGADHGLSLDGADFGITVGGQNVSEDSVFISNDIIYYEDMTAYPSGNPYGEGAAHERHSADEAAAHTVVNITQPGTYRISGSMEKGQIRVDLGEDAFENPEAVVTLILDGLDINCDVAPAILFLNVYECDNQWSVETASSNVDTAATGANLIIADGSVNNIDGGHVAKIFKDNNDEKKLWKQDGAIYSYMSMNVSGETAGDGVLNLTADNEGLDTELHLTVNGGNINIFADNDGINTNEDGVSVTTINDGNVHIMAGLGAEGDGIDSNGWLVINGGTVISSANPGADAGLDSDMGSFVNGGTVVALGSTMDWAESESEQITMNLQFADYKDSGSVIEVRSAADDSVIFSFDPASDSVLSGNARKFSGAVISCPAFTLDAAYHVYVGGIQQSFTSTDVFRFPGDMNFGGGFVGGQKPGDFNPGQLLEGFDPSQMPEGGFDGQMPGNFNGQMPQGFTPGQMPGGMQMPNMGFDPSQMQAGTITETSEPQTEFYMQDKVNAFSGITDTK